MASFEHFQENPFLATEEISAFLSSGSLTLFLGAGISSGFGLPSWPQLVATLVGRGDDPTFVASLSAKSDKDVSRLVDPFDTEDEHFVALVREALYPHPDENITKQLVASPLLLAVAALTTGTKRGRIQKVFTYNYDDLLETYLRRLGLVGASRYLPTQIARWSDVEINHVHGFVPRVLDPSVEEHPIVLSENSYRKHRAKIDAGWSAVICHSLQAHIGLFIGLSGDDSSILDVVLRGQVERQHPYTGYWLMTPAAFDRNYDAIRKVGMCPIKLDIPDFPEFVFDICERAALAN